MFLYLFYLLDAAGILYKLSTGVEVAGIVFVRMNTTGILGGNEK